MQTITQGAEQLLCILMHTPALATVMHISMVKRHATYA